MRRIPQACCLARRFCSAGDATRRWIRENTVVSRDHLTPELGLHLITPATPPWTAPPEGLPFDDPFWAFYWPGGQAVSRFLLDHAPLLRARRVLDVGSGSGACAIAASLGGAPRVTANDVDPVAGVATLMNAALNGARVEVCSEDLVGSPCEAEGWDCVLCGDVLYDAEFAARLVPWLRALSRAGKLVLIGDPGRQALKQIQQKHLELLAEYPLSEMSCLENAGFTTSCVWKVL